VRTKPKSTEEQLKKRRRVYQQSGSGRIDALVICNGEPPARTLVRRIAAHAGRIVAADGGANIARRYGTRLDLIVGDLDSISPAVKRFYSSTRSARTELLHVPRQDSTDLEKTLDVLLERGATNVTVVAATGKRIDHTLGNLSVLWSYTHAMNIRLVGDGWLGVPVGKRKRVRAQPGTIVSLIPFGACSGITLRGLQYPLLDASMRVGQIGLSNVVVESPFTVRVNDGNMLMIIQADPFTISIEQ
jgi:thiamine pyrophosphokinase